MTTGNFYSRFEALARLVMLALASCAIAACVGHAPSRPAVAPASPVASAPAVREHGSNGAPKDEAEVKRNLAKNSRDALNPSEAGYYLDVLQARLVQVLGADVKLSRTPDRIGIDLAHRVQFESSSPWLSETSCKLLRPLASALAEYRKTVVGVKVGLGGADKVAERLAARRARAVAECLSRSGIASRRIVIRATSSAEAAHVSDAAEGGLELDVELILRDAKSDK